MNREQELDALWQRNRPDPVGAPYDRPPAAGPALGGGAGAGARYGKIVALYQADLSAWTASNGYPRFASVHPCDGAGGHENEDLTLYVRLPPRASRALTAVDDVVAFVPADGTETAGGESVSGHVVGGVSEDRGLAILDDDQIGKLDFWHSEDSPDEVCGYATGWEAATEWAGRMPIGYDSEDEDFDGVGESGGSKTFPWLTVTVALDNVHTVQVDADGGGLFATVSEHDHYHTGNVDADQEALPPYKVVNFIRWAGISWAG